MAVRPTSAERTGLHVSLLAGLLSQIGMKVQGLRAAPALGRPATQGARGRGPEYLGARGARFAIFPGSALARKPPDWVVAAELVETSRLWARTVARIEPEWAEPLARHLVKRSYSEPHWETKRGAAIALEKVTLYGVPLVADRKVPYGRIDPAAARELFIRHALVEGDWQTSHQFFAENRRLLAEAEELEHRARRRGLVATTTRCSRSTTSGSRPTWCPPGTSTPGGSRPAGPTRTCSRSRPATCSTTTPPGSAPTPTPTSGPRSRPGCPPPRCPTSSSRAARPTA